MKKRSGLGKGLDALFVDNNTDNGSITTLRVSEIEPNKDQPRRQFDSEALRELADSIRDHGVLQPLVVRSYNGAYQIVAGERRWRAARMAGLSQVPVVIRDLSDTETLEIAIIENLQREDLNLVELAKGYKVLMDEHGYTQEQVAARVGKSRPVVANTVRILSLPEDVLEHVGSGKISMGHAKALLALEDTQLIKQTASRVVEDGLLVREIEKLAKSRRMPEPTITPKAPSEPSSQKESAWGNNYYKEVELALTEELGRKVTITGQGSKSVIQVEFYSNEELASFAFRLSGAQGQKNPFAVEAIKASDQEPSQED
ncbi:ParB/RepB/Spo0J family partition protein [Oscillospiraceae bacterium MB08-C2-2]|nr:ParB/RepB/Spo0J family partition protein [Oscillospiraceae bacterium MB08-C2-2]